MRTERTANVFELNLVKKHTHTLHPQFSMLVILSILDAR